MPTIASGVSWKPAESMGEGVRSQETVVRRIQKKRRIALERVAVNPLLILVSFDSSNVSVEEAADFVEHLL